MVPMSIKTLIPGCFFFINRNTYKAYYGNQFAINIIINILLKCSLCFYVCCRIQAETSREVRPHSHIHTHEKCFWWWGSSPEDLESVEYLFIAITSHPGQLWLGVVILVTVLSMSRINLFKIY